MLRALLGLIPRSGGEIIWNGEPVTDPASFFVPPRSAYTAQLPQLFSDSLEENVLMGQSAGNEALARALRLAVMQQDLSELPQGLSTQVGARGVKLSGGQVQRAAVARMLAQNADLLVFDDVSSALDAETERQLWLGLSTELPRRHLSGRLAPPRRSPARRPGHRARRGTRRGSGPTR